MLAKKATSHEIRLESKFCNRSLNNDNWEKCWDAERTAFTSSIDTARKKLPIFFYSENDDCSKIHAPYSHVDDNYFKKVYIVSCKMSFV